MLSTSSTGRPMRWPACSTGLAMVALQQGRADEALLWLEGRWRGPAAAWAAAGRALALLLLPDRSADAEDALREVLRLPGRAAVDAEVDAVRVLLVWRQEGAAVARALAEQLDGPGAGVLHRALLAALRQAEGDHAGADRIARQPAVKDLLATGLGRAIEELATLRM